MNKQNDTATRRGDDATCYSTTLRRLGEATCVCDVHDASKIRGVCALGLLHVSLLCARPTLQVLLTTVHKIDNQQKWSPPQGKSGQERLTNSITTQNVFAVMRDVTRHTRR